ncbi:ATP-dependent protease La [Lactarius akahatsu]|uniref:Lon protease homolog n=1 Tax=Lactarius akahatsu TaxID=416441 RepID=A0AAD4LDU8_9AGAM|nr:ATP-dependent protease La [Lactarius akahatsu]
MEQPTLPLIILPFPLVLLPGARATFPIPANLADALLPTPSSPPYPSSKTRETPSSTSGLSPPRITRFVRPRPNSDEPHLLTLTGLARVRLTDPPQVVNDPLPLPRLDVSYPPQDADSPPATDVVQDFKAAAIRLLERFSQDTSQSARKRESWTRIAHLVEESESHKAAALADAIISAVGAEHADKLVLLSTESPSLRLQHVTNVLAKQLSIVEVSSKIATAVDESLSKQQKALFLRQQLAAISAELQRLEPGIPTCMARGMAEVRRAATAEARRLKRIPPQNAEHGVVRTYLEWLTSLPWTPPATASETLTRSDFLTNSKSQLDADHYGLEKVKRRLMEYLAVVRLRALIAQEAETEQAKAQEVTLKKVIDDPAGGASEADGQKENACRALIKAGEIPALPQVPVPVPPPQSLLKAKGIKAPILLFIGPPGTGKTSLGQSIARALGRPFQRIALGGVRDEAEIRGHRRTYVASGPGLLAQALRKAGRMDPVLLLDEIDKVGQSNYHGDPSAALLEVLDPEQNVAFNDHYLNVPIDLSQILFICTANSLDTISPPLLDRCEVIQLSGYTHDEKLHIARRFLLPKQLTQNGLSGPHVQLTEPALLKTVTHYTREAGVRSLERSIGGIVRFKAVEWAAHVDAQGLAPSSLPTLLPAASEPSDALVKRSKEGGVGYNPVVEADELEKILGLSRYDGEDREREARRGVVWGLVVTGMGEGEIMPVESIATPGSGHLKLTGSLGDVIKESAELALSWVKTHSYDLGITSKRAQDPLRIPDAMIDIHLHLPAGAQKKDGPSAGVAMVCAMVSLLTGKCVPPTTAMTGEITLRGRVSPVGGVKEKVLGAHRAGANKVIVPWANRKDVEHDVPKEVRARMQFVFARTVREVLDAAFGEGTLPWHTLTPVVESRL